MFRETRAAKQSKPPDVLKKLSYKPTRRNSLRRSQAEAAAAAAVSATKEEATDDPSAPKEELKSSASSSSFIPGFGDIKPSASSSYFIPNCGDSDDGLGFLDLSDADEGFDMFGDLPQPKARAVSIAPEIPQFQQEPQQDERPSRRSSAKLIDSPESKEDKTVGKATDETAQTREQRRRSSSRQSLSDGERKPPNHHRTSRRSSEGDVAESRGKSRQPILRKLSEPMHRCTTTNSTVLGIMRPARYSSSNLASLAGSARYSTNNLAAMNGPGRYTSSNNLSGMGKVSSNTNVSRTSSCLNFESQSDVDKSNTSWDTVPANEANWVANGVVFSKSMEVYVFKSRNVKK